MHRVDERHEVGTVAGELAPGAGAEPLPGHGVQEDLVVAEVGRNAGGRVGPAFHPDDERAPRLAGQGEVGDAKARLLRLQASRDLQRWGRGGVPLDEEKLRIEPGVELVVERNDRAGETGDGEKRRRRQSHPAVEPNQRLPHCGQGQ